MGFRIVMCFLLFISSKWTAQGQFMFCSTDDECKVFGFPSCGWGGFCDIPLIHTDCDYLGAGSGKMITIDGSDFCTRTCSSHSDCSHLPTAKVCQTESSFPNYNTCVECKDTGDCTAIGFKNHICPEGFCKHPNPSSTDCQSSDYCHSPMGVDCYDDTIKCWAVCVSDSDCGATGATCLPGVTPMGESICSFPANFPPSAVSSSCVTDNDCPMAEAAQCSSGNCVACDDDLQCTRFSLTPYCGGGSCRVCRTSDHGGCSSITAPKCDSTTHVCTTCDDDLQCVRFSSTPYCGGGSCRVCQTSDHGGCTSESLARCDSVTYTCTACSSDSQCTRFSLTPYCGGGSCRVCRTSDHGGCTSESLARCDSVTYTCSTCDDDSQCSRFPSTPYCEGGQCRSCKTSDNTGCTAITAAKCTSIPLYACIACSNDADCVHLSSTPYCEAGTCTICKISDNTGCTVPTSPKCISTPSFQCAPCTGDEDCNQFPSTPYCEGGTCRVCKISDNTGCSTAALAKCTSTPTYQCTVCSMDSDCTHLSSTPYCEGGTCVYCKTSDNTGCGPVSPFCDGGTTCQTCRTNDNEGCTSAVPRCVAGTPYSCTTCSTDVHCTRFTSTSYCGGGGECVICLTSDNSGCNSINAPKCISNPAYSCTVCTDDSDCIRFSSTPYCEGGTCRPCKTSDHTGCTTITLSKCTSSPSYQCIACSGDTDCSRFTLTPYCEGGECRPCKTSDNSGCPTLASPKCVSSPSYSCTTCNIDADCSRFSSTPFCEDGACVLCKVEDNSGCITLGMVCITTGTNGNICTSASNACATNTPPIAGTFDVTPITGGTPLSTSYLAILNGWTSQGGGGSLTYALEYIKASPLFSDPIQISDLSSNFQYNFYLPYTSVATIRVIAKDESDCSTTASVDVILTLSPPNGTELLQTAITLLNTISLEESSLSLINTLVDQINIANQLLLCSNNLNTTECNTIQGQSCGASSDCSNHGQCTQMGCICYKGYYLKDCSLNQFNYDLQTELRQSLMDSAVSNITSQNIPEMMSIVNALTQKAYLNPNSTLNMTLNAATQAIQVLNSSTDYANLSADIQAISEVISNGFDQITQLDCGLYNNFSLQALNKSYDLLQELSDIFTKASYDTPDAQLTVRTNAFLMYLSIYNSSNLNNLKINIDDSSPQIQINSLQNQASLPPSIALTYTYLKKDPLKCDSTPATNFTLAFKNAENLKDVKVNASILITYPQNTFGQVSCPQQCRSGSDSGGSSTCFCKDISIFDVKNQLGRLFENSNLRLLTLSNIAKIFTSAIYLEWSFWVVVVSLSWLIVTLIVVKTCNKDYCFAKQVRREKNKIGSRSNFDKFLMYFAVIHPILGIYCYKGAYATSKAFRALIYFVRVMSLLGTSAVFMKNPENPIEESTMTFGGEMLALDIYLILAPLVIVLPIMFIIQKTLAKPKPPKPKKNNKTPETSDKPPEQSRTLPPNGVPKPTLGRKVANIIGIILSILLAIAGIISALTITLQINSSQKLSWAAKFTKSIAQDLIISPLITLGINFIALTCSRRVQKVRKAAKFLTGEPILELSSGTIGIPPPLKGRSASTLVPQTTMTQNKRMSFHPQMHSRNATHLSAISDFSDPHFTSAITVVCCLSHFGCSSHNLSFSSDQTLHSTLH